jgi:hypothetical protein
LPGLPDGIFFKPKIPIWVNFGGSCNGRCWYIIWSIGLFYGYMVYFVANVYILGLFVMFFPALVYCNKRNLATLVQQEKNSQFFPSKRIWPFLMHCSSILWRFRFEKLL